MLRKLVPVLRAIIALAMLVLISDVLVRNTLLPALGLAFSNTPDFTRWPDMLVFATVFQVLLAVVTLGLFRFVDRRPLREFGLSMDHSAAQTTAIGIVLMVVGFGLLIWLTSATGTVTWQPRRLLVGRFVLTAAAVYLGTGLWEEFFFRGYLFSTLSEYGKPVAYALSGAVFVLIHFNEESLEPLRLVSLIITTVSLTYLYDRTRSIWPGVVLHGMWNLMSILLAGNVSAVSLYAFRGNVAAPLRITSMGYHITIAGLVFLLSRSRTTARAAHQTP